MSFQSLAYLISLARPSDTVLNISDKSVHPCFISDFRGKPFNCSTLHVMLSVDFFVDTLYQVEEVFFSSQFLGCFRKRCWIFSDAVCASVKIIMCHSCFILLMSYIVVIDSFISNQPEIGIKTTWSWCIILSICCCIPMSSLFIEYFLHSCSQ